MAMIFVVITAHQLGAQGEPSHRACGSEIGYDDIIRYGGEVRARYEQLERFTQQYIQNLNKGEGKGGFDGERASPIIIPVVVHIVWNAAEENIPDARVTEQIDRLNLDYQRLNTDASSVPAEFSGVATNMQIRFQLAARDPNCMATTGITRTNTTQTSFSVPSDVQGTDIAFNPVKSTAAGGIDAWPADRYLNIWVCNMTGGILGYSSFPGFPANVDGVVILYSAFGNTSGNYNLGRTATHEIGHYLNLFHPFQPDTGGGLGCYGTTATTCATSGDRICDTPP
ncbi:MAG TPA: M43 family zinc metalloprotease, partial [Chthoniobacterales bacterium]